jgi:hypothetical protein
VAGPVAGAPPALAGVPPLVAPDGVPLP